ncbi:MAG TPA: hypothetical protein VIS31_00480 [Woeseiaceae bacterium]
MVDDNDPVDWRKLREFAGVSLTRSYVLSWHAERDALVIDIDLLLEPEHPFYEAPRPAEKVCIRPACIEFPYCERLAAGAAAGGPAQIASTIPGGIIEDFRVLADGHYEMRGDFGNVSIRSERPILRLKGV